MDIKILEIFDGISVIRLPVRGFEYLSLEDKMIAYHLWQASVVGDSITYDQSYRYGLRLRDLFLELCSKKEDIIKIDKGLFEKIEEYTKKILINHGNHDGLTTRKFTPRFTEKELNRVIDSLKDPYIKSLHAEIPAKVIFDPGYELMLTQKTPMTGDIITESHNTFYQNMKLKDLERFEDRYPGNSTLVKDRESGKTIEKVWRAGNNNAEPGMYSKYLKKICYHLEQAMKHSNEEQKEVLGTLKMFFEEGNPKLFDDYNIKWLQSDTTVDTILGFIEEYRDARSKKALFEGMVFFKDKDTQHIISDIASKSQALEDDAPWDDKYKKTWSKIPVSNAIMQVAGTGGAGPLCWAGVNLPNNQKIREEHGSKSIYVSNVTYASRNAFAKRMLQEFIEDENDRKMLLETSDIRSPVTVTLHEIVGHGSGKASDKLENDPRDYLRENYSAMEEARAELCMLYHAWNPDLSNILGEEASKAIYLAYILSDMAWLRGLEHDTELHEDHMRATHLIVQYILRNSDAAELYVKGGKTYPRVKDYSKMREIAGELLKEIQRIKSEGDYDALKKLIDEYAVKFDHKLRDEVVKRAKEINFPKVYSYVMAEPIIVKDEKSGKTDVVLTYPESIIDQGRRWRELSENE